jgi:hypothetical protein
MSATTKVKPGAAVRKEQRPYDRLENEHDRPGRSPFGDLGDIKMVLARGRWDLRMKFKRGGIEAVPLQMGLAKYGSGAHGR